MKAEPMTTLIDLFRLLIARLKIGLKQSFQIQWTDPDPSILHTDHSINLNFRFLIGHNSNYNDGFFFRKLDSILDQVNQDLLDTKLVDHQIIFESRLLFIELLVNLFGDNYYALLISLHLEHLDGLIYNIIQI